MSGDKVSLGARTLVYPTPVFVIGSYDREGRPNVMTAAWGGVVCSSPPSISVSVRPSRHTYKSVLERRAFTISIPSEDRVKEVDYFGIASGRKDDKFARSGLTPVRSDVVDAPYVGEFPLVLECRLSHTLEVGIHVLFIGEIVDVKADGSVLREDGLPDFERVRPILFAPEVRLYYGTGRLLGRAFDVGRDI